MVCRRQCDCRWLARSEAQRTHLASFTASCTKSCACIRSQLHWCCNKILLEYRYEDAIAVCVRLGLVRRWNYYCARGYTFSQRPTYFALAQIPNFHRLSAISFLAAVMSLGYSTIGIGTSIHTGRGDPTVSVRASALALDFAGACRSPV